MNKFLLAGIFILVLCGSLFVFSNPDSFKNLASVFFVQSVSQKDLQTRYAKRDPIRILIIPGHDNTSPGAVYKNTREADINVEMAKKIFSALSADAHYSVTLARDQNGYTEALQTYFDTQKTSILNFRAVQQDIMRRLINAGLVKTKTVVSHNTAPTEVVLKLYGINKWANETKQDILIHVHFNDYPGRPYNKPGVHAGFAVYVPESQYSNADASIALGDQLVKSLSSKSHKSTFSLESAGLIEDQELIAIGSNNSLDGVSALIEYGYIYESQFQDAQTRDQIFTDLAYLTVQGIQNFLKPKK